MDGKARIHNLLTTEAAGSLSNTPLEVAKHPFTFMSRYIWEGKRPRIKYKTLDRGFLSWIPWMITMQLSFSHLYNNLILIIW